MTDEPWIKDLSESAKNFITIVWPKIKHWFGDGRLVPVESITEHGLAELFDKYSGIDYWYIESEIGIRGIGSRCQKGRDYTSFTIRKSRDSGTKTEYEKLTNAIENGWIFPYWFCQSYIDSGSLLNVGLGRTEDIIMQIKEGRKGDDYYINRCNNAVFYVIYWRDIRDNYPIKIFKEWQKGGEGTYYPYQIDPVFPPYYPFEINIESDEPIAQPYENINLSELMWNPLPRRQPIE